MDIQFIASIPVIALLLPDLFVGFKPFLLVDPSRADDLHKGAKKPTKPTSLAVAPTHEWYGDGDGDGGDQHVSERARTDGRTQRGAGQEGRVRRSSAGPPPPPHSGSSLSRALCSAQSVSPFVTVGPFKDQKRQLRKRPSHYSKFVRG